jgi:hypothetical protein
VKPARILLAIIAIAGGSLAWWLANREPAPAYQPTRAVPVPPAQRAAPIEATVPVPATVLEVKTPPDIATRFHASMDYLEFAASIFDAAKRGDGAARFFLFEALNYCESAYGQYFAVHLAGGEVRYRTMEEALQFSATHPTFTPEELRDMQARCEKLVAMTPPPFGTYQQWLDAAGDSGYPAALALLANQRSYDTMRGLPAEQALEAGAQTRHLLIDALRSKDPQVIFGIGDTAAILAGRDVRLAEQQKWIWTIAACGDEAGCSSLAGALEFLCRADSQCQPYETPLDIIRRKAGNDFDEIQRRARELRKKIDDGTLEEGDI